MSSATKASSARLGAIFGRKKKSIRSTTTSQEVQTRSYNAGVSYHDHYYGDDPTLAVGKPKKSYEHSVYSMTDQDPFGVPSVPPPMPSQGLFGSSLLNASEPVLVPYYQEERTTIDQPVET